MHYKWIWIVGGVFVYFTIGALWSYELREETGKYPTDEVKALAFIYLFLWPFSPLFKVIYLLCN